MESFQIIFYIFLCLRSFKGENGKTSGARHQQKKLYTKNSFFGAESFRFM